ncbi:MarR family winged helix-turn-helix transcriptional regulator [Rhodococcus jostii]|uniref:MarR family winged helix-turn-helix transcriptional regulator n=1 Tax=Rhodococcus jostii TaxID=132919 RepID=UPI0036652FD9
MPPKNAAMTAKSKAVRRSDPVDWASYFWEENAIGEERTAFLAMSSMLRFHRLMTDALEVELKKHGLGLTDYLLLMTLELSENGTRLLSRLAKSMLVHATTITLATDRLEDKGLVSRHAHPTDRRATYATITDEGRQFTLTVTNALKEIRFGLVGSSPTQQRKLLAALSALRSAAGDVDSAG